MNVQVTLRGIELNRDEAERLRRKAEFAFDRFVDRLESVHIVLEDFNGPRGGEDKVCRLILRLVGQPPLILQERGSSTLAVGMSAIERAQQSLGRRMARVRG